MNIDLILLLLICGALWYLYKLNHITTEAHHHHQHTPITEHLTADGAVPSSTAHGVRRHRSSARTVKQTRYSSIDASASPADSTTDDDGEFTDARSYTVPTDALLQNRETHQVTSGGAVANDSDANDYTKLKLLIANMTAHHKFTPLFNLANTPVTTSGHGEKRDVFPYALKFVYTLGKRIGMGLSIIDINTVRRYTTETQTLYRYNIVLQRTTPTPATTMAILRVDMVLDYSQQQLGDNFFDDYLLSCKPTPKLQNMEVLDIVGHYQDIDSEATTQHWAIDNGDDNGDFISEQDIQREVQRVRAKHNEESSYRNVLLDETGTDVGEYNLFSNAPNLGGDLDNVCRGIGTTMVANRLTNPAGPGSPHGIDEEWVI